MLTKQDFVHCQIKLGASWVLAPEAPHTKGAPTEQGSGLLGYITLNFMKIHLFCFSDADL